MHPRAKDRRKLGLWLLAFAALAAGGRAAQLAWTDLATAPAVAHQQIPTTLSQLPGTPRTPASGLQPPDSSLQPPTSGLALDAELGRLYMACPASSVVDWAEVTECVTHAADVPTAVDQLLARSSESAWSRRQQSGVPRVKYPAPVRVAARADADGPQLQIQSNEPLEPAQSDAAGDWLVNPEEWFVEESPASRVRRREQDEGGEAPSAAAAPGELPAPAGEDAPDGASADDPAHSELFAPPELESAEPVAEEVPAEEVPATEQPAGEHRSRVFDAPAVTPIDAGPVPGVGPSPADGGGGLFAPPPTTAPTTNDKKNDPTGEESHRELFAKNAYPSAKECAKCHKKIYDEWASSSHAYATISPMFQKFEQKINSLTQGTIGYFCYRCHAPVATSMCESRVEPLWNLAEVAREGVTCIACHRVQYRYTKTNGERRIEPGPIFAPVFGGMGGDGVAEVVANKSHYKVKPSPHDKGPGQDMHMSGIYFDQLSKSEFCVSCHQVAVHPGIKLEVVWEQYRASPACKKGIRCQDCHMGRIPGVASGFEFGAAAEVAGKTVNKHRKHSNHIFYGPGYSIAHPGIFPHHLKADRWTMDEWLLFDWRAGWGTDDFEEAVDEGRVLCHFPDVWKEADDRYDAREIVEENLKKLAAKREVRRQVMENGSHVDGPFFDVAPRCGQDLKFNYIVTNTNEGHNLPSGSLGAQPQLWANVVLVAPDGRRVWESGYTDSYGDVADIHSEDVRQKRLPFDWQLFNLQTMFLISGVKGTDREMFLPVNVDIDQLPFIRPGNIPITVTNHPPFIRMEGRSLAPLGSRVVPYEVPGELVRMPGRYRLSFRMRSRAEPIYFMRYVGATVEMQRAMNEWIVDVHPYSVEFEVR